MDVLPFKQAKTVWRLIIFHCDIQTVGAIFQTCKDCAELSQDESVWRILSKRHYDCEDDKIEYRCKHFFGDKFALLRVNQYCKFTSTVAFHPKFLFLFEKHVVITVVGRPESRIRPLSQKLSVKSMTKPGYHHDFKFDPIAGIATYSGSKLFCTVRLDKVLEWIFSHFSTEDTRFTYCHDRMVFRGELFPCYIASVPEDTIESYKLYYDGGIYGIERNRNERRLSIYTEDEDNVPIPCFTDYSN